MKKRLLPAYRCIPPRDGREIPSSGKEDAYDHHHYDINCKIRGGEDMDSGRS